MAKHADYWPLRFISVEAASGVVLLIAAALALGWENSPWASGYEALWHLKLGFGIAQYLPASDLHFWVNDGLMTVFFLVVGLEIRREIHDGSLSNPKVAALPMIAAVGGVVVPALLYVLLNADPVARRGWAIPTATDIAFAVGILSLVGKGVPSALRMLLLTLAIIDDIAAILVIAFFYSSGIALCGARPCCPGRGAGPSHAMAGHPLGARVPRSGRAHVVRDAQRRHASHARRRALRSPDARDGELRPSQDASIPPPPAPVEAVEAALHPWVAFGIMPLFALANAGVSLPDSTSPPVSRSPSPPASWPGSCSASRSASCSQRSPQ